MSQIIGNPDENLLKVTHTEERLRGNIAIKHASARTSTARRLLSTPNMAPLPTEKLPDT